MLKHKKHETHHKKPDDVADWLAKISEQLERLIVCHEFKVSGQVIKDFKSKDHLNK